MLEDFSLKEKIAFVVGGGSGIGQAIAIGFAKAGAHVIAGSRNEAKLLDTVNKIKKNNVAVWKVLIDVKNKQSVENAIKEIINRFGRIDILVNSGGTHLKKPSLEVTDENWDDLINTNLTGIFRVCREVGKYMKDAGHGSIINIASINGFIPFPETLAYCVSKAGVIMMTQSLAADWAQYGIRVNAIAPGVIPTDLNKEALKTLGRKEAVIARTPMGRLGATEEIAGTAIYLASEASKFVTGQTIAVDGGFLARGI